MSYWLKLLLASDIDLCQLNDSLSLDLRICWLIYYPGFFKHNVVNKTKFTPQSFLKEKGRYG